MFNTHVFRWKEELSEGEKELGFFHKNDAESVIVRANCTFRGYDHEDGILGFFNIADGEDQVEERGDAVIVVAEPNANKAITFDESDSAEDVDDDISFVSCRQVEIWTFDLTMTI